MVTVSVVAAIMYKNLGVSNADIALHTGLLYLPWSLKPLWAPITEMVKTKRHWVLAMQLGMAFTLAAVALSIPLPGYLPTTLAFFWVTAFLSSTHDIAADGVYISVMSPRQQASWVGVQGICWNAGRVLASGVLVAFTGYLFDVTGDYGRSWMIVMGCLAVLMALLAVWHLRHMPADPRAVGAPRDLGEAAATFWDTLRTFFQKPGVWLMIAFIVLYRSGEGFLEKIGPLFMMDAAEAGGLALSNQALGTINGTFGTFGFMGGALLGGLFAAKMTLRRSLFVLCMVLNVPNLTYVYLAFTTPSDVTTITALVTIEKIGYGFGSVGHMLYMMQQVAPGKYRTAHYAFATSLMNLGLMLPSSVSGYVQEALGYQNFFLFVLAATIPSFIASYIAPFHVSSDDDASEPSQTEATSAAPKAA
jgi:PAT family beta-lactamase induction signal transducer AmpG